MEKRREYTFCPPERDGWCVPSAVQSVLKTRGIEMSQAGIAAYFSKESDGYILNNDSLAHLLKPFKLKSQFFNPFMEQYGDLFNWKEVDETLDRFMGKGREDVLVSYANPGKSNGGHVSVVSGFDLSTRLVRLIDLKKTIPLSKLFDGMHPGDLEVSQNSTRGFYVIS